MSAFKVSEHPMACAMWPLLPWMCSVRSTLRLIPMSFSYESGSVALQAVLRVSRVGEAVGFARTIGKVYKYG